LKGEVGARDAEYTSSDTSVSNIDCKCRGANTFLKLIGTKNHCPNLGGVPNPTLALPSWCDLWASRVPL
jgi:hypothetical protein